MIHSGTLWLGQLPCSLQKTKTKTIAKILDKRNNLFAESEWTIEIVCMICALLGAYTFFESRRPIEIRVLKNGWNSYVMGILIWD